MSERLGWGVVGCGDVVEKKSGPSIFGADRSRIVAVMRRDAERARPFAEAHGVALCTSDADAVIDHDEVDIVYVATPPASHKRYVLAAAAAGRHVLVEKPMGLSVEEDRAMIDACERAGVELFVAYYRRFQPHVERMKALIDAGRIGTPVMGRIDLAQPIGPDADLGWRLDRAISAGGIFVDAGSHRVDLMNYLLGEPIEIGGSGAAFAPAPGAGTETSPVEQAVAVSVRFDRGALGSFVGDFVSGRRADRFAVVGTGGAIEAEQLDSQRFTLRAGDETERFEFERFPAPHLGLIRHIERVLAGDEPNRVPGQAGLLVDRIFDKALRRRP